VYVDFICYLLLPPRMFASAKVRSVTHFLLPVLYLGQALERQGLYNQIWSYWRKVFFKNDDILEAMLRIDTIFESKLYVGALRKELSPWVAIFSLKHNHKWCDRPEVEPPLQPTRHPMLIELDENRIISVP